VHETLTVLDQHGECFVHVTAARALELARADMGRFAMVSGETVLRLIKPLSEVAHA
jgi:hypothetical protein